MPNLTDYSDYFSIVGLPETITRSTSDTLNTSESLSRSVSTWRVVKSAGDLLQIQDTSLVKSVSTWKQVRSLSDTQSIGESLSVSTAIWLQANSHSDLLNTSESLARTIQTWRETVSFNMTQSLSDSLTRATETWREVSTQSDTQALSDSLAVNVETWKFVLSPSKTLNVTDTFTKSLQDWKTSNTNEDTLAVSDNFSIAIGISDDIYFYDNIGLRDSNILRGTIASGNFTSDTSAVTSPSSLVDGSIGLSATFKNTSSNKSCVVFDVGSQKTISFIGVHLNESLSGTLKFYGSNSQGSGYQEIGTGFSSTLGWTIIRFDENYRFYGVQCENLTADSQIGEILIGDEFIPDVRYDSNSSNQSISKNIISESLNGSEYVFKNKDAEKKLVRNYSNISSSLKSKFETLSNNSVTHKMIYTFDGLNYGVIEPMKFQEVSHNRYQTQVTIAT